jgi:hypothetical protein
MGMHRSWKVLHLGRAVSCEIVNRYQVRNTHINIYQMVDAYSVYLGIISPGIFLQKFVSGVVIGSNVSVPFIPYIAIFRP